MSIKNADKQYLARVLFVRENLDQKTIAKRVGVSEQTISKWVNDLGWKKLKNRLLLGKDEELNNMFEQLSALNEHIKNSETRYPDNKTVNIQRMLTSNIRDLETDLGVADLVESGIRFIKHLQQIGTIEQVYEVSDLWNSFIQSSIKK